MVVKASISSIFIIICCSTAHFRMVVKVYLVLIRMVVRNCILSIILLILYLLVFFERQFKTNVQGFIFMNLYWPIGNCRYQLAFSFIEIIYVLQCPRELSSQGLLFSYYICRFCVCFFYEMKVISHKNLAFFPNQNGKI